MIAFHQREPCSVRRLLLLRLLVVREYLSDRLLGSTSGDIHLSGGRWVYIW